MTTENTPEKVNQNSILRIALLQKAFNCLHYGLQFLHAPGTFEAELHKADSIIEILEVEDCGSTGGYDRQNPNVKITGHKIYDRFLTVLRKYDNEKDIQPVCSFTPADISIAYKTLSEILDLVRRQRN
ncbi:hypothetical protein [Aeromonas sp. MrichA-1]|uniref:hypothetical protein n=1 Tax=Aeromonas sp. MrichA-1 TaxID=2823362 RepID=UPI001B3243B9|nr:hypothetical protein [Aeromonas sp. MrichA-1]MBP4081389.1 hypothetical protein [Aeromonas sp. MrichA-1]